MKKFNGRVVLDKLDEKVTQSNSENRGLQYLGAAWTIMALEEVGAISKAQADWMDRELTKKLWAEAKKSDIAQKAAEAVAVRGEAS